MHLSYRGVSYSSATGVVYKHRPLALRQLQTTVQRAITLSTRVLAAGVRSASRALYTSRNIDMATLVTDPTVITPLGNRQESKVDFEARYHAVERDLQLAYAVGDRANIVVLEAEIERLTGWRFHRRR